MKRANGRLAEAGEVPLPERLTPHKLRHTYATRLVSKHLPLSEVGRVLGHTQPTTTYRYVNANVETARRAADALNELHATGVEPTSGQPAMIN